MFPFIYEGAHIAACLFPVPRALDQGALPYTGVGRVVWPGICREINHDPMLVIGPTICHLADGVSNTKRTG